MGEPGGRPGRLRALAEFLVGTIVVLLARSRRMPSRGWRAGAVEIQLPFATGQYRFASDDGTLRHQKARASGVMRPLLFAGFLFAFAGLGVGFGGLDVGAPSAFAPGTPGPQVDIVHVAADPTEPPVDAKEEQAVIVRAVPTVTATATAATATATSTLEPTASPTEPPPTATPEPAAPEPTATALPATPAPEPEPSYDYYPVSQLTDAEFRAMATQAGWPVDLHDQLAAVARCESSLRPNAQSAWAYGIMQLVPSWFDYAGQSFGNWPDPVVNLTVAHAVYIYDLERGNNPWAQWVCKPPAPTSELPGATVTPTGTVLAAATNESTDQ